MKLFDYKFLILLGLTLVVYFIYREVEYLRGKVDKIESEIKNNKLKNSENLVLEEKTNHLIEYQKDSKSNNDIVLELPKKPLESTIQQSQSTTVQSMLPQPTLTTNSNKSSPKMIAVDISATKPFESGIQINTSINKFTDISQKTNNNCDSESDSESEDNETTTNVNDSTLSESSKHLAIYSNDNEQFDETQNSLLESVEANKNEIKINYDDKLEIPNLKATVDDIIHSILSESVNDKEIDVLEISQPGQQAQQAQQAETKSQTQSEIDQIIEEKEKQLSEMSIKSDEMKNIVSNKVSEKEPEPETKQQPLNNENNNSNKYTEESLNNMKLAELKKIAEKYKITITKKVNGQQKPKTKQDFINEIVEILSK